MWDKKNKRKKEINKLKYLIQAMFQRVALNYWLLDTGNYT